MPDHPIVSLLGPKRAEPGFRKAMPASFRFFAKPVNDLREEHGLPAIGGLREILCWGDRTAYPDVPELAPAPGAPSSHVFLGPVLWAPPARDESWRSAIDPSMPFVYLTLGSSGAAARLQTALDGLADLPVRVLAATAGRARVRRLPSNATLIPFAPGDLAARAAAFVISNGGSTTGYQALAEGTPVIGIARNLDQYLASQAIEAFGAGITLRSGALRASEVRDAAETLLGNPRHRNRAQAAKDTFARYDANARFARLIEELA